MSEWVGNFMGKLGAVPVTPRNMYRLVKAGEAVLLYPGGAKEALHLKVYTCDTLHPFCLTGLSVPPLMYLWWAIC